MPISRVGLCSKSYELGQLQLSNELNRPSIPVVGPLTLRRFGPISRIGDSLKVLPDSSRKLSQLNRDGASSGRSTPYYFVRGFSGTGRISGRESESCASRRSNLEEGRRFTLNTSESDTSLSPFPEHTLPSKPSLSFNEL
ncbi:hypothetical protein Leryth_021148 [Lithospermum erythrorhizon]|nr:hypothetical protein Leryth_021148 [Lithospermum erythrorhizon]